MRAFTTQTIWLASLLTLGGTLAHAATNFVMGGPQVATLAANSGGYGWDGQYLAGYRGALTNSAYFGPGAPVSRAITTTTLTAITPATLSGVNAFIAPWWYNTDSAAYNTAVVNFFQSGGSLFLLDDQSAKSGVAAQLGVPTHESSDGSVSNGAAPLFIGPFGSTANVTQNAEHGYLVLSEITAHGGFACSTNASGQITAACFNPGAYSAGAGAMVITTDVDMITTADGGGTAIYSPLNGNAKFALNATAFLMTASTSSGTPPPHRSGAVRLGADCARQPAGSLGHRDDGASRVRHRVANTLGAPIRVRTLGAVNKTPADRLLTRAAPITFATSVTLGDLRETNRTTIVREWFPREFIHSF